MKKLIVLIATLPLLSACTLPLEVKQIRTDLNALHRASTTANNINAKINELNKQIEQ